MQCSTSGILHVAVLQHVVLKFKEPKPRYVMLTNWTLIIAFFTVALLSVVYIICQVRDEIGDIDVSAQIAHSRYSIFFIESNYNGTFFSDRQLCSIESAAKHNPDAAVHIKTLKTVISNDRQYLLAKYPNIKIEIVKFEELINKTPLAEWWKKDLISKDPYFRMAHMADAMRLVILYAYGGIYSDLDTITLKSFVPLLAFKCGFAFQDRQSTVTNSFIVVPQKNHPFLKILIQKYTENYDGMIYRQLE